MVYPFNVLYIQEYVTHLYKNNRKKIVFNRCPNKYDIYVYGFSTVTRLGTRSQRTKFQQFNKEKEQITQTSHSYVHLGERDKVKIDLTEHSLDIGNEWVW